MTLGDATPNTDRRPWTFAAVCVMVPALTLMVFNLADPVIQLLPWYVATYLLIGACIFGPTRKLPSLRQAGAFLLPGALLVPLALTNVGWWCGGWLLGLPAWGLLLSRWTPENPLPAVQVLKFPGLLLLGMTIYTVNGIYPIPSLGLFLLPIIPSPQPIKESPGGSPKDSNFGRPGAESFQGLVAHQLRLPNRRARTLWRLMDGVR
jgi:hypothetical protein